MEQPFLDAKVERMRTAVQSPFLQGHRAAQRNLTLNTVSRPNTVDRASIFANYVPIERRRAHKSRRFQTYNDIRYVDVLRDDGVTVNPPHIRVMEMRAILGGRDRRAKWL